MTQLNKLRYTAPEWVRYSKFLRECAAQIKFWQCRPMPPSKGRAWQLAQCYARARRPKTLKAVAQALGQMIDDQHQDVHLHECQSLSRYHQLVTREPFLTRTLPVKAPGPNGEKGVMLTYFEYNWLRLFRGIPDYTEFTKKWTVVLCSSWSPTDYSLLGLAANLTDGPVYVQPCNLHEVPKLQTFHPSIRPVPGLPCDWLNPAYYNPLPWEERDIDILMVANWAPFKRHWEFFHILRKLPSHLRVVCVGQPECGHTMQNIQELAKAFRVPQQIEYLDSIPIEQVTGLQCRAKIAAIFSRWEGCCVAAAEALFSGAILAMKSDAYVGPRAYINENTGIVLKTSGAHLQIMEALTTGHRYRTHEWATQNISCHATRRKLNDLLREDAQRDGRPWTSDILSPCWRPYPRLINPEDSAAISSACADLHERYPQLFPLNLIQTSWR